MVQTYKHEKESTFSFRQLWALQTVLKWVRTRESKGESESASADTIKDNDMLFYSLTTMHDVLFDKRMMWFFGLYS